MQTGRNSTGKAEFKLALVLLTVIVIVLFQGCQKPIEIPAKAIVGAYTSGRTVYFADQSDSCTQVYDIYDSTGVNMRWDISYYMDNLVNVVVSPVGSDTTIAVASACQLGRQYSFPMNLRGVVGGSTIVIERSYTYLDTIGHPHTAFSELGNFDVVSNTLLGSFVDLQCDSVHCYGFRTVAFSMHKE